MKKYFRRLFFFVGMLSIITSIFIVSSTAVFASNPRNTSVGAIRWDGWPGTNSMVGLQSEKTLSINNYHYRLPFFAQERAYDAVTIKETQADMDQQLVYAANAGLDYWAFCYYSSNVPTSLSNLNEGLTLYLNSSNKNLVKFSLILGVWDFSVKVDGPTVVDWFKQSYYQTVNIAGVNRPLLYIFGTEKLMVSEVNDLKAMCTAQGANQPYIVIMDFDSTIATNEATRIGADAISAYCYSEFNNGAPYSQLVNNENSVWDTYKSAAVAQSKKLIPFVTTGWSPKPRIDNPLSYTQYYSNHWSQDGTPQEIANHLQDGLTYCNDNQAATDANTVIMYAWNEFDEGGWICPSLYYGADRLNKIANVLGGSQQAEHGAPSPMPTPLPYIQINQWSFNNNLQNALGFNNGKAQDGNSVYESKDSDNVAQYAAGVLNDALIFNGAKKHVIVYSGNKMDGFSAFTIGTWVKLDQLPMNRYAIMSKVDSEGKCYRLSVNPDGTVTFELFTINNPSGVTVNTSAKIDYGKYYYVTVTYDGSNVRIYINASLSATSGSVTGAMNTSLSTPLVFGYTPDFAYDPNVDSFRGGIDEVVMWDRSLSSSDVVSMYNYYNYTPPSATPVPVFPVQVGRWNFDNANANDSIGSNHGTMYSGYGWIAGKRNWGLWMYSGYGNIPDASALDGMSKLTVSTWIRLNAYPSGGSIAINKEGCYRIYISQDGTSHFVLATTNNAWYSAGTVADASTVLDLNKWYQLTGTYDGSYVRYYINGALAGTGTQAISGSIINNSSGLQFGSSGLDCRFDEMMLYSNSLNANQVIDLYNPYNYVMMLNSWKMDGNADSDFGSKSDGTLPNGGSYVTGIKSQGLSLNGTNQYVTIPKESRTYGVGKLTISAWVKMNALPESGHIYEIVQKGSSYRLAVTSNGAAHFAIRTANNGWYTAGTAVDSNMSLTTGAWYQITGVYDGKRVHIYVNGMWRGTGSQDISGDIPLNDASPITFGYKSSSTVDYFNGIIDEIQMTSKLHSILVQENYNSF